MNFYYCYCHIRWCHISVTAIHYIFPIDQSRNISTVPMYSGSTVQQLKNTCMSVYLAKVFLEVNFSEFFFLIIVHGVYPRGAWEGNKIGKRFFNIFSFYPKWKMDPTRDPGG